MSSNETPTVVDQPRGRDSSWKDCICSSSSKCLGWHQVGWVMRECGVVWRSVAYCEVG